MRKDVITSIENMEFHVREALKCLETIYPASDFYMGDPHNTDTPKRIVKSWLEMSKGLGMMDFNFTTFPNESLNSEGWIIKKDIEFSSMCQHHFMPFFGKVHIGYVPEDHICGISKLDRVVNYFSKRPQVQERLGDDIQHFLYRELRSNRIVVIVESTHTCVACRGIESRNSSMITTHAYDPKDLMTFKELIK